MTDIRITNGPPRFAHKTTYNIHKAAEYDEIEIFIGNNYPQIEETEGNHYADTKYGVYKRTIVRPMGKVKATKYCSDDCSHEIEDGKAFYRTKYVAEAVADANRVITPKSFVGEDVCAYYATKFAIEHADVMCLVPQMVGYIKDADYLPRPYQVHVDEESTQNHFRPSEAVLSNFQLSRVDFGPSCICDRTLRESSIDEIRQREQRKVDDLERVASRYTNILNAADFVSDLVERITEFEWKEDTKSEDFKEYVENLEIEAPELEGPESEHHSTFERLRTVYGRFAASSALEAAFFEPSLQVNASGQELKVRLIPNPTTDYLLHKDFFENAERLWLVGDVLARDFASKIDGEIEFKELPPKFRGDDELSIISVKFPDYVDREDPKEAREAENQRRGFIKEISRKLGEKGKGHALFAGSIKRAERACESVRPNSYFFSSKADKRHYEKATGGDEGWAAVSYANSTISRGIDLPTDVSGIISKNFSTGIFDYESDDPETRRYCSRMREYTQVIEVHNMMLRGAGQGEPHVTVIPATPLYYGLEEYITEFTFDDEASDIVTEILALLDKTIEVIRGVKGRVIAIKDKVTETISFEIDVSRTDNYGTSR